MKLTGAALVQAVCVAIMGGAVVSTRTHEVGACHLLRVDPEEDGNEVLRFACVDTDDLVQTGIEEWTVARNTWSGDTFWARDWSAFGAAEFFVREVSERAAMAALRRHQRARRAA
jgi:hypothetical protein